MAENQKLEKPTKPQIAYRVQLQKRIQINKSFSERRNQAVAMRILSYGLFGQKRYQNLYLSCSLNCFNLALRIANNIHQRVVGLSMIIKFQIVQVLEYFVTKEGDDKFFEQKKYSKILIKLTRNPTQEDKKQAGYHPGLSNDQVDQPLVQVLKKKRKQNFRKDQTGNKRRNRRQDNRKRNRSQSRSNEDRDRKDKERYKNRQNKNKEKDHKDSQGNRDTRRRNDTQRDREQQRDTKQKRYRQNTHQRVRQQNNYRRGQTKTRGTFKNQTGRRDQKEKEYKEKTYNSTRDNRDYELKKTSQRNYSKADQKNRNNYSKNSYEEDEYEQRRDNKQKGRGDRRPPRVSRYNNQDD